MTLISWSLYAHPPPHASRISICFLSFAGFSGLHLPVFLGNDENLTGCSCSQACRFDKSEAFLWDFSDSHLCYAFVSAFVHTLRLLLRRLSCNAFHRRFCMYKVD